MSNETKFKLARFWIKLGLLILGAAALVAIGWGLLNTDPTVRSNSRTYREYINGVYTGTFTTSDSPNEAKFLLLLVGGAILASVVIVLLTRKDLVDFEGHYSPLSEGSLRRKITFGLAVVLGWTGIDRLSMGCVIRALMKAFLGLFVVTMLVEGIGSANDSMLTAAAVFGVPLLYWWSVDALLIGMGVAKKRGGVYLG